MKTDPFVLLLLLPLLFLLLALPAGRAARSAAAGSWSCLESGLARPIPVRTPERGNPFRHPAQQAMRLRHNPQRILASGKDIRPGRENSGNGFLPPDHLVASHWTEEIFHPPT